MSEETIYYNKFWPQPEDPPSVTVQADIIDDAMYRIEVKFADGVTRGLSGEFGEGVKDKNRFILAKLIELLAEVLADTLKTNMIISDELKKRSR